MSNPLGIGDAQPRRRPNHRPPRQPEPEVRDAREATGYEEDIYPYADEDLTSSVPSDFSGDVVTPVNPYAPVGWQKQKRLEFDVRLPDKYGDDGRFIGPGQLCRIMRMERDDLFRLDLMQYLNTFASMLMGDQISDQEREKLMQEKMEEDPEAMTNMLTAIDKVVQAAAVIPRITEDPEQVNIGTPEDWNNPNFVPVVPLDNIPMMDRMFIFGASFGRSMDDLKSVWEKTNGVAGMADVAVVQSASQ